MVAVEVLEQSEDRLGVSMGADEDIQLMAAIASDRDREAFARLYERHERAAYNLARYLLRNDEDAQDALQEGFAQVWASAATFSPGNPRAWILRIVARKCFLKLKKARRQEELAKKGSADPAPSNDTPDKSAERGELTGMLRRALERLSGTERQIVALYYGAGLSQADVANAMAMPQRTVSYRVKEILSRLRTDLTRAGVAAAITQEAISEAVCSGHAVPTGIGPAIVKASIEAEAVATSGRVLAASPFHFARLAACLVGGTVLAAAGASVWIATGKQQEASPNKKGVVATGEEKKLVSPLPLKWSFEKGPPADLKPAYGTWKWVKSAKGKASHMHIDDDVWIPFPSGLPREPMLLVIQCRIPPGAERTRFGTYCVEGRRVPPRTVYLIPEEEILLKQRAFSLRFYIWGRLHAAYHDRGVVQVIDYERDYSTSALYFALSKMHVHSIELRAIKLDEIPAKVRVKDLRTTGLFKAPQRWLGYEWGEPTEQVQMLK